MTVCSLNQISVIAAALAISGIAAVDGRLGDPSPPIEPLSRPFGIGLWQIERCLLQEGRQDRLAVLLQIDHPCPVEQKR